MSGLRASLALASLVLVACSSSSQGTPGPSDAGADVGVDSAPPPYVPIGNVDDSGSPTGPRFDSGLGSATCMDLQTAVNQAAIAAAACNPADTQQCTAETPGICCAITVSFGADPSLIDNVEAAVAAFKNAGCSIDCTKIPCAPAPSKNLRRQRPNRQLPIASLVGRAPAARERRRRRSRFVIENHEPTSHVPNWG